MEVAQPDGDSWGSGAGRTPQVQIPALLFLAT